MLDDNKKSADYTSMFLYLMCTKYIQKARFDLCVQQNIHKSNFQCKLQSKSVKKYQFKFVSSKNQLSHSALKLCMITFFDFLTFLQTLLDDSFH